MFWGDTVVEVSLPKHATGRTGRDETLALTFQIVNTYGLERAGATG